MARSSLQGASPQAAWAHFCDAEHGPHGIFGLARLVTDGADNTQVCKAQNQISRQPGAHVL